MYFWWACRSGWAATTHISITSACSVSSAAVAWTILRDWIGSYKFRGRWTTNPHGASDVSNEYFCFALHVFSQVMTNCITCCERVTLSNSQFMWWFGWYYIELYCVWLNENGVFVDWYWWETLSNWRKPCASPLQVSLGLGWDWTPFSVATHSRIASGGMTLLWLWWCT
jgi:hypothetical protein